MANETVDTSVILNVYAGDFTPNASRLDNFLNVKSPIWYIDKFFRYEKWSFLILGFF